MIAIKIFLALYCFLSSIGIMSSCAVLSFFIAPISILLSFSLFQRCHVIFFLVIFLQPLPFDMVMETANTCFFEKGLCLILISIPAIIYHFRFSFSKHQFHHFEKSSREKSFIYIQFCVCRVTFRVMFLSFINLKMITKSSSLVKKKR